MELLTISTGSRGNCYFLKSANGKTCILDCGIKYKDITKHIETFMNIDFVFCSHDHKDHSLSLKNFELSGCECISFKNVISQKKIKVGQWTLLPFQVAHNELNYGVIIYDEYENKKVVYATDFSSMPKIKNVDNWIYEINYDNFTVNKMIEGGYSDFSHLYHNLNFHNSLENAIEYFEKVGKVKTFIACHLSNIGGLEDNIKKYMHKYAENVYISKKNKIIKF